jgi:hypothetical protein
MSLLFLLLGIPEVDLLLDSSGRLFLEFVGLEDCIC